jgi:hypothetical protein
VKIPIGIAAVLCLVATGACGDAFEVAVDGGPTTPLISSAEAGAADDPPVVVTPEHPDAAQQAQDGGTFQADAHDEVLLEDAGAGEDAHPVIVDAGVDAGVVVDASPAPALCCFTGSSYEPAICTSHPDPCILGDGCAFATSSGIGRGTYEACP